jgi:archaellum component FlaC
MSPVTQEYPEKYGKRLIGRTDMEDALKRLDNLTHEEARMAIAENLRATHAVDERVRGVTEQVLAVDDKVARIDDRVAGVDDRVAGVDDRVAGVDDRVAGVDDRVAGVDDRLANVNDKVTEVIHGVCQSTSVLRSI